MRSASRTSYAAVQEQLDAYADHASSADLRTLGEQLISVAALLSQQPRLRRVLSDPSRSGEDRAGLLRSLVSDQVGEPTAQLLDALVASRWSAGADLLDACEEVGVHALLASAERDGNLAEVEDELFRFRQVVAGDPELAVVISDRAVPVARRGELVDELLTGKATEVTIRAVKVALGGFGGRSVAGGLTRLVELAAQRRDRSVAYVTVAAPLTDSEEQRLGSALAARYGRDVSLKTTVDPRVLGGMRVQVGADLYDGTIARRLAHARTALASG